MIEQDSWINDHCLRGLHSQTYNEAKALQARIDALEAENARLREAIGKLVNAKGRYHSEQNYKALAELYKEST